MVNLSIKWQLIIISVLLVTIPVIVLGIWSFASSKESSLHNIEESLRSQCIDWSIISQSYYELIEKNKRSTEDTTEGIIASQASGVLELIHKHLKGDLTAVALREPFLRARKHEKNMLINVYSIHEFENYLEQFNLAIEDMRKIIKEAESKNIDTNAVMIALSGYLKEMQPVKVRQVAPMEENKDIAVSAGRLEKEFSNLVDHLSDERLKEVLAETIIGKTGYVYIINYIGEYILSKKRKHDRESIWYVEDNKGRFIIQDVVMKGKSLREGEIEYFPYSWREEREGKFREQLVALTHVPKKAWIVGVVIYPDELIASDFEEMKKEELKILMAREALGKTGHLSIIGGEGDKKGVYILSKDRKFDGQNVLNERDARGNLFIKEIVEDVQLLDTNESRVRYYFWREPWERFERQKLFAYTYFKPWNWVITSSVYLDEFFEDASSVRNRIFLISLIAVILASLVMYLFGSVITRTAGQLVDKMDRVRKGNLEVDMDDVTVLGERNEIGRLAKTFKQMIDFLRQTTFSKDYIDNIIANINDALFVIDRDARIVAINNATSRLLDCNENEIVKYHIGSFFIMPDEELRALRKKLFDGGVIENLEMEVKDKKGTSIPVLVNGAPLEQVEGKVTTSILLTRDISEHRRLLEELSDAEKDLQDKAIKLERSDKAMLFMVEDLNKTTEALKEARAKLEK